VKLKNPTIAGLIWDFTGLQSYCFFLRHFVTVFFDFNFVTVINNGDRKHNSNQICMFQFCSLNVRALHYTRMMWHSILGSSVPQYSETCCQWNQDKRQNFL